MSSPKRILLGFAVLVMLGAGALAAYWVSENQRFDRMRAAVDQFSPPSEWSDPTLLEQLDRSYSPLCVPSARCPAVYRRYVAAAPAIDIDDIVRALTASGYSQIDASPGNCPRGPCEITATANGIDVRISTLFSSDSQQSLRENYDLPTGLIAFTFIVASD